MEITIKINGQALPVEVSVGDGWYSSHDVSSHLAKKFLNNGTHK